jgi:hypothetical protein
MAPPIKPRTTRQAWIEEARRISRVKVAVLLDTSGDDLWKSMLLGYLSAAIELLKRKARDCKED